LILANNYSRHTLALSLGLTSNVHHLHVALVSSKTQLTGKIKQHCRKAKKITM